MQTARLRVDSRCSPLVTSQTTSPSSGNTLQARETDYIAKLPSMIYAHCKTVFILVVEVGCCCLCFVVVVLVLTPSCCFCCCLLFGCRGCLLSSLFCCHYFGPCTILFFSLLSLFWSQRVVVIIVVLLSLWNNQLISSLSCRHAGKYVAMQRQRIYFFEYVRLEIQYQNCVGLYTRWKSKQTNKQIN